MRRKKQRTTSASGCFIIDYQEFEKVCREREGWAETVLNDADLSRKTIDRIRKGLPIRPSSLGELEEKIGPENMARIARRVGSAPETRSMPGETLDSGRPLHEWIIDKILTKWVTTTNGLQFRVVKLRHQHIGDTWARGKCYELGHLSDDDHARLRDHLVRHPTICRKLVPHRHIAINERTFPDPSGSLWWVVDQWVPGTTLVDVLAHGSFLRSELLRVAREIAEGLRALHGNDIICRELNPHSIVLREVDQSVVLTDFELGKLLNGDQTVSKNWPEDPYRAPEVGNVGDGSIDFRADIYSWGRIVAHLMLGKLPAAGREGEGLRQFGGEPRGLAEIVLQCVSLPRSQRPHTVDDVISSLDKLQEG